MEEHLEIPEAPPIPEPPGLHLGLIGLAGISIVMAVFVLMNGFAPLVGGGVVSAVSVPMLRIEQFAQATDASKPQREQIEREEQRERFLRNWKLHLVIALASVPIAVGLVRCGYFASQREFAYGELQLWFGGTIAVVLFNLLLGWGGGWSIFALITAIVVSVLLHVPSVKFYLAEATPEQIAIARGIEPPEE